MNAAEELIVNRGFSGTSIEKICEAAYISRPGFFYHFPSKDALAVKLLERYFEKDEQLCRRLFAQADALEECPLKQLLAFFDLLVEHLRQMEKWNPRWLVANFIYEKKNPDSDVKMLIAGGIRIWRSSIEERLQAISAVNTPRFDVDLGALSDMFITILEGNVVHSRIFESNSNLIRHLQFYRQYLNYVFGGE